MIMYLRLPYVVFRFQIKKFTEKQKIYFKVLTHSIIRIYASVF